MLHCRLRLASSVWHLCEVSIHVKQEYHCLVRAVTVLTETVLSAYEYQELEE